MKTIKLIDGREAEKWCDEAWYVGTTTPVTDNELFDTIAANQEIIAEMEAANRWIPVSERLPELNEETLIADKGGSVGLAEFLTACDEFGRCAWSLESGIIFYPTHWKTPPAPPETLE